MRELVKAMQATGGNAAKFDRFAAKVLNPGQTKSELRAHLVQMTEIRSDWNDRNKGDHDYGFARLDAIGAIFNEVAATAIEMPGNVKPANAPVSYPFIWDTPQHDRVQWNGSVENKGPGAIGRNIGEVLGVFGYLKRNKKRVILTGHKNSVVIENLGRLEELLWDLQSPEWPEAVLGSIDRTADVNGKTPVDRGRETFDRLCQSCHENRPEKFQRSDCDRRITAVMTPISDPLLGTDSMMASNFAEREYSGGPLKLRSVTYLTDPSQPITNRFKEEGNSGVSILGYFVAGVLVREFLNDPKTTKRAIDAGRPGTEDSGPDIEADSAVLEVVEKLEKVFGYEEVAPAPVLAYKARPLNGIWATAPYLHNGSVRTMRQLLLPESMRQTSFKVGSREYDPEAMGFVDAGGFTFDTGENGNSNAGHTYGATELGVSGNEQMLEDLLEYLKTL